MSTRVPWAANGSTTDPCCEDYELAITYDWRGKGMFDLDTKTEAFSETVGWSCGDSGTYVLWLQGGMPCGDGICDDVGGDGYISPEGVAYPNSGFERVDVRVNTAKDDGYWTSSYNIECYAGWYESAGGSGEAVLSVTYKGKTKTKTIYPGSQSSCADTAVATITVYAEKQEDGSYFEII